MQEYYSLLGLQPGADAASIKKAYHAAAKKHHPDLGGDAEHFKKISEAYEYLTSTDRPSRPNRQWQGSDNPFFDDLNEILRGMNPGQKRRRGQRNSDMHATLSLSLEELNNPVPKTLTIRYGATTDTLELDIPSHAENGAVIRFPGLGDNSIPGLTRGDLFVKIHLQQHRAFVKKGLDLYADVTIDCFDAMLGTHHLLTTLDGKSLKINIPAGTQHGTVMKLRDKGLTFRAARGNILVRILVEIPNDLDSTTRSILDDIRNNR